MLTDKELELGPIEKISKKLCEDIGEKLDHGILEEIISLFNSGVLKLYLQTPRQNIDHNNLKLTVSQCYRVLFAGKEKIKEQEAEIEKLNEQVKLLEATTAFYANKDNWTFAKLFKFVICPKEDVRLIDIEVDGKIHTYLYGGGVAKEALQKLREMREKK